MENRELITTGYIRKSIPHASCAMWLKSLHWFAFWKISQVCVRADSVSIIWVLCLGLTMFSYNWSDNWSLEVLGLFFGILCKQSQVNLINSGLDTRIMCRVIQTLHYTCVIQKVAGFILKVVKVSITLSLALIPNLLMGHRGTRLENDC